MYNVKLAKKIVHRISRKIKTLKSGKEARMYSSRIKYTILIVDVCVTSVECFYVITRRHFVIWLKLMILKLMSDFQKLMDPLEKFLL